MNIKQELTCKHCKEILNEPITLNCCGENICKEHLSELLSNESSKKSKKVKTSCPICSSNLDKQGLNVNKLIQKLVENNLHEFKIYPKYKELIKTFKNEIEALEKMVNESENLVNEKFSQIKNQVNLERTNAKTRIDRLANDIIEKLVNFEKEIKLNRKMKLDLDDYNEMLNESKKKLNENEKFINFFSTDNSEREEKSAEIKEIIHKLEYKRYKLKKELFGDKKFKFKETNFNGIEDNFGKLIVSIYYKAI